MRSTTTTDREEHALQAPRNIELPLKDIHLLRRTFPRISRTHQASGRQEPVYSNGRRLDLRHILRICRGYLTSCFASSSWEQYCAFLLQVSLVLFIAAHLPDQCAADENVECLNSDVSRDRVTFVLFFFFDPFAFHETIVSNRLTKA